MSINVSTGEFVPPVSSFNEEATYAGPTEKPTFDDFSGKSVQGVSTPRYHAKLRAGILIPATPWKKFQTSGTFSGYRQYYETNASGVRINTYTQAKPHTNNWDFAPATGQAGITSHEETWLRSFVSQSLIDDVVTRALVNLRSPKHDTLTWLAELEKTYSMFRNLGRNIAKYLSNHPHFLDREAANAWLEWRYGWRQLLFDCQDIEDALNHISRESHFWKSTSGNTTTLPISRVGTWVPVGNTLECVTTGTVTVSYRGVGRSVTKPPSFGGNVAVTLWEIVPFSFVIDWFINIGQKIAYLSTCVGNGGDTSHYGLMVECKTQSVTSLVSVNTSHPGFHFESQYALAEVQSTLILRDGYTPSLIPSISVHLDKFKVADIIALVIQAWSRVYRNLP